MFEGHRLKGHSLFIAHGSMVVGERDILLEDFEGGGGGSHGFRGNEGGEEHREGTVDGQFRS